MRIGKAAEAFPKAFSKLSGRFVPFVLQIAQVHIGGITCFTCGEQAVVHAFRLQRRVLVARSMKYQSPKTPQAPRMGLYPDGRQAIRKFFLKSPCEERKITSALVEGGFGPKVDKVREEMGG